MDAPHARVAQLLRGPAGGTAKREIVEHSGVLEYFASDSKLEDIAGLVRLKEWLSVRAPVAGSGLNVRMQLQLHKYIWGPDVKGV